MAKTRLVPEADQKRWQRRLTAAFSRAYAQQRRGVERRLRTAGLSLVAADLPGIVWSDDAWADVVNAEVLNEAKAVATEAESTVAMRLDPMATWGMDSSADAYTNTVIKAAIDAGNTIGERVDERARVLAALEASRERDEAAGIQYKSEIAAEKAERALRAAQSNIADALDSGAAQFDMMSESFTNAITNGASQDATSYMAGLTGNIDYSATVTWNAVGDDRTREAHLDADGQEVGLNQPFEVGGEALLYPGDPSGSDENTINCRCWLTYDGVLDEADAEAAQEDDSGDEGTTASSVVRPFEEERGPDGKWLPGPGKDSESKGTRGTKSAGTKAATSGRVVKDVEAAKLACGKGSPQEMKAQVARDIANRMGPEHTAGLAAISTQVAGPWVAGQGGQFNASEALSADGVWTRPFDSAHDEPTGPWRYEGIGGKDTNYVSEINQEQGGTRQAANGNDPTLQQDLREQGARSLVSRWAQTSNDSNAESLALQETAEKQFGLTGAMPWETSSAIDSRVQDALRTNGATYAAFLQAQYDSTQETLRAQGIGTVQLHRGFSLEDTPEQSADEETSMPSWMTAEGGITSDIPLRPMSSFTAERDTAEGFTGGEGVVITSGVPAERILSMPTTGFGCKDEAEYVVLAGRGDYSITHVGMSARPAAPFAAGPFEYNDNEERGEHGRWIGGGAGKESSEKKDHTAPTISPKKGKDWSQSADRHKAREFLHAGAPTPQSAKAEVARALANRMGPEHTKGLMNIGALRADGKPVYSGAGAGKALTEAGVWTKTGYDVGGHTWVYQGAGQEAVDRAVNTGATTENIRNGNDPQLQQELREQGTSKLVQCWAATSNDDNPASLAVQEAVKQEFGLQNTMDWKTSAATQAAVDRDMQHNGDTYRAFVRAQYDETQSRLKEAGINSLQLYRGFRDPKSSVSGVDTPKWFGNVHITNPPMRPLSSFTSDKGTASGFADWNGRVIRSAVPVERVLGTPRTGVGCLNESEFVILAGKGSWNVGRA